ncbi:MAG: class I tRNA ligase family protein, partial [Deinococcus sp.]|nr:class I tRNA ligase family protein [Deinococcus sp.]
MFKEVPSQVDLPALERAILEFWKKERIFQRSLEQTAGGPRFLFYEGPPTANGKPGIHHMLARAFKDLYPRYKTMRGYHVGRKGGWDTHGLPVEIEVEKEIGSTGKADIEKYGLERFNVRCRESVFRYVREWERLTERMAFWVDVDAPYITFHNSYIETGWWILRQLWDRGLLFEDYKVTMHCPRCNTSLADHEVAQGFRDDVDDPSVWVKFRLKGSLPGWHDLGEVFFLAWTTTPWTLPANAALALAPSAQYLLVQYQGQKLILAQARAQAVLGRGRYKVIGRFKGEELEGLRYEPLYQGVQGRSDQVSADAGYRTITDTIVSLVDGTGMVHIAPAYGDLEIGRRTGLPTFFSVDLSGTALPHFPKFGGKFFKDADPLITADLEQRGLLLRSERVKHNYPFCWRCEAPLLYYAKTSWYIRTTAVKERLIALNQTINWVPEHIKNGRFGDWLNNNVDWALSRERFWGTPLPIWRCQSCGYQECIGSVAELSQ